MIRGLSGTFSGSLSPSLRVHRRYLARRSNRYRLCLRLAVRRHDSRALEEGDKGAMTSAKGMNAAGSKISGKTRYEFIDVVGKVWASKRAVFDKEDVQSLIGG